MKKEKKKEGKSLKKKPRWGFFNAMILLLLVDGTATEY